MSDTEFNFSCPFPIRDYPKVLLGHGSGGKLMHDLVSGMFLPAFGATDGTSHDGALVTSGDSRLAFTTDSYVVSPLIFPGGDIGSMAVYGTVNDLAMCGARPLCLSLALILEEGLAMETLKDIIQSVRRAADRAGVRIVTGDTKVVDRGKGDGLFINTTGIGEVVAREAIGPRQIREGDAVLLSGDVGRHGIAIMGQREGLSFESDILSDSAPVWGSVAGLIDAGLEIHCLRDATRGGVATTLNEMVHGSALDIQIHEDRVPVEDSVRGACEILGLDPLYIANEGRFLVFVPGDQAEKALAILHQTDFQQQAVQIGKVGSRHPGCVTAKNPLGTDRILDMLQGEQLPRIC